MFAIVLRATSLTKRASFTETVAETNGLSKVKIIDLASPGADATLVTVTLLSSSKLSTTTKSDSAPTAVTASLNVILI
ncbi:hypothetical protein OL548_09300 [Lysinibacillus sp. MHQ-1]|nr:hypothetical protein OL548_09300 [Lysinibacillus sp. MHQ-1]